MAGTYNHTYDYNRQQLDHFLSHTVNSTVESEVILSLQRHGAYPSTDPDDKRLIEQIGQAGGSVTVSANERLIVDTGGGNLHLKTFGSHVIGLSDKNTMLTVDSSSSAKGDTVFAGSGTDHITSLGGNDKLVGGSGSDTLRAGGGYDTLVGGSGHSVLYGSGSTVMYAGSGTSELIGGQHAGAHDTLYGGSGHDILKVSQGNNLLVAGKGHDTLYGGSGHDTLVGGGQSLLHAGSGDTQLYGSTRAGAHDTMVGGSGDDSFHIRNTKDLHDTVRGGGGQDVLHLSGYDYKDAQYHHEAGGVTVITFKGDPGQSITVSGVQTVDFGGGHKVQLGSDHVAHK